MMSAFIVGKTHIDLLVTAGIDFPTRTLRWSKNPDGQDWDPRELRRNTASEVGSMLWAENLASVAARYPRDESGERPGPIGFADEEVLTYRWQPILGHIDPVAVLKAIACYEYQSCEHDGWITSEARRFCQALQRAAHYRLPGYEEAPWEFDDPRYFLNHTPAPASAPPSNPPGQPRRGLIDSSGQLTVEITRDQLESWAGGPLTDEQVADLDDIIPNSTIPEAVNVIVTEAMGVGWDDDETEDTNGR